MQEFLVIVFIAAAVFYLGYRSWKAWSGKQQKGCEKCGPGERSKS